ncbi:hypothetical protein ABIA33_007427 [Streptacidiphilus sp. MAP12-16]|uniref:hypothetical protein n=1 Tax=Streptacidiphilus sp. MAP12-16 TaxID=3156300 RepID=UPI0035167028
MVKLSVPVAGVVDGGAELLPLAGGVALLPPLPMFPVKGFGPDAVDGAVVVGALDDGGVGAGGVVPEPHAANPIPPVSTTAAAMTMRVFVLARWALRTSDASCCLMTSRLSVA